MNTSTVPMAHLGVATQPVPGAGQIILVFIGVAALAIGMAFLLRRYGPGLGLGLVPRPQSPSGVAVTVLARQRLEPGVSLQIVEVGNERLAVLTSRSGVAMHALRGELRE